MLFVEYDEIFTFMGINKEAAKFFKQNFILIRNGFINEGLIDFCFNGDPLKQFSNYYLLEKLYF
jgi:hypothetical protein